tara:strand:- start:345 stop:452 length:108 start_codon:yes stop_codon:yes gene_type:complete
MAEIPLYIPEHYIKISQTSRLFYDKKQTMLTTILI